MSHSVKLPARLQEAAKTALLPGALAGLVGGIIFAVTMAEVDRLTEIAQVVRADSNVVGFIIALVVSSIVGAGFGALVWFQQPGPGETLIWGLIYGVFWWYLGPLTLQPLFQGEGLTWDVSSAQAAFPMLLGLVLYGASTALALLVFRATIGLGAEVTRFTVGGLTRGMLAGLVAAALLAVSLNSQDQLLTFAAMNASDLHSVAWSITLLIGLVAGAGYALLYPSPSDGAGAAQYMGSFGG